MMESEQFWERHIEPDFYRKRSVAEIIEADSPKARSCKLVFVDEVLKLFWMLDYYDYKYLDSDQCRADLLTRIVHENTDDAFQFPDGSYLVEWGEDWEPVMPDSGENPGLYGGAGKYVKEGQEWIEPSILSRLVALGVPGLLVLRSAGAAPPIELLLISSEPQIREWGIKNLRALRLRTAGGNVRSTPELWRGLFEDEVEPA